VTEYDIVVITESKLDTQATSSSLALRGFLVNRLDRNKHGGGVLTYCKSNLNPSIDSTLQDRMIKNKMEITITKVSFSGSKLPVYVLGVYRPPNAQSDWFTRFNDIISDLTPLGSLIIMGDLNADLRCPGVNPTKALCTSLSLAGAKVKSKEPTRITPHSATCLDLIAVDKSINCLEYKVGSDLFSDHLPVIAKIKCQPTASLQPVRKRSFRGVDFDQMKDRIGDIQLPEYVELDTVVGFWNDRIIDVLDEMAPLKNYPWRRERCPWITSDIRSLMKNREVLIKKLKRGGGDDIFAVLKTVKKQIKSRIRREVREAGKTALTLNDSKKAWQFIKSATFTQGKSLDTIQDLDSLNNFFASTVRATNPAPLLAGDTTTDPKQHVEKFKLQEVTPVQVLSILKSTRSSASAGPDGISGYLIKELAVALNNNVTNIFNMSIRLGSFPASWKRANIVPVWKGKGCKKEPSNFRPISILPILARILEKLLAAQLYRYCDANSIIPVQQFGFRQRSSCEMALIKATDSWIEKVDSGLFVGALLIDLSKAFDSVPHQKLLDELCDIGCSADALKWFCSYLSGRQQRVTQQESTTPWVAISQGVPQGSGLSPLLFNIYMRHLPQATHSEVIQFADDVTGSVADKNIDNVLTGLSDTYNEIKKYCNERELKVNANKTQLIVFKTASKKVVPTVELMLDGHIIKPLPTVKLLGFNLDHHFQWGEHIDKTVKKCHGIIGALRKATPVLTHQLLRLAYIALVRSQLEYCSILLTSASDTQLKKLDIIQKIAARTILQAPRDAHAGPLLETLRLDSLDKRRETRLVSLVKSIISGDCHPAFTDFFDLNLDGTLNSGKAPHLKIGQKRFKQIGARFYNRRVEELRAISTNE
jgi:endonuclease/exonuclease/phosphatase family metal-dependent hydrolase